MKRLLLILAIAAAATAAACSPDGTDTDPEATTVPGASFEPLPSDDLSSEPPSLEAPPSPSAS